MTNITQYDMIWYDCRVTVYISPTLLHSTLLYCTDVMFLVHLSGLRNAETVMSTIVQVKDKTIQYNTIQYNTIQYIYNSKIT